MAVEGDATLHELLPFLACMREQVPVEIQSSAAVGVEALLTPVVRVGREGVPVERATTAMIAAQASRIVELAPARIYELLTPALCGKYPHMALQWLRDTGMLAVLLPELDATVAFSQEAGRRHKDVWEHTKAVTWQAVPRPAVRWAAVLHDIGKVTTRRYLPGGKVTFHGHAEEGVRMFQRGPARRIGFPLDVRDRVAKLILFHLRAGQYDESWTDSAVRRFAKDMEPWLTDLLDLSRADVTSRRPGKRQRCLASISELAQRIRELAAEDAREEPLPAGLGNLLMQALGLSPGKHIGELRDRLASLHANGEIAGGQSADYYLEIVRERGLLEGIEIVTPRLRSREAGAQGSS